MKNLGVVLHSGLLFAAAASLHAAPLTFTSGDLFWASASPAKLYDVKTTGSQSGLSPFATLGGSQYGEIAFSNDLTTAYVTVFSDSKVLSIDASGNVSTFATGIDSPTGLVMTLAGHLMVSSYNTGRVYDVTGGGNYASATPYATGLVNPRTMIETGSGILVADQGSGKIMNLGTGGNLASKTALAWGLSGPVDIVQLGTSLYASTGNNKVVDITAGGNMASKSAFAFGQNFFGLATDGTRLLAATDWTSNTGNIWDITNGGNFASATAAIRNLPGSGDTLFDFVPTLSSASNAVPEPGTAAIVAVGLIAVGAIRRRR